MPRKKDTWGDAVGTAPWAAVLRPAPGDLRILQALLNTVDRVAGTDELSGPPALVDWMARWGLAAAGSEIDAADLERTIAVREGLRALPVVPHGKLPHPLRRTTRRQEQTTGGECWERTH